VFDISLVRAMYQAVIGDDANTAKKLLEENSGLDEYSDASSASWFNDCAAHGSMKVAKLLLDRGWTVHSTPGGRSIHPLWNAKGEHYEMAKFLLDNGADPNMERSLIGAINSEEPLKWVKLFVDYGADVNWCVLIYGPEDEWATPLSWAKDNENQDVVNFLLSKGAVMPDDPRANKQPND
jgi:ankyrin repeat protein